MFDIIGWTAIYCAVDTLISAVKLGVAFAEAKCYFL